MLADALTGGEGEGHIIRGRCTKGFEMCGRWRVECAGVKETVEG